MQNNRAVDGTGRETHHASHYFVRRRANNGKTRHETTYRRFPNVGVLCDCRSHLILAIVPGRGPAPDVPHFREALDQALARKPITTLVADAGYDAVHIHEYAREECSVNTFIPPLIGRPTKKKPSGFWRRRMASRLHLRHYVQRWQIETVNSMLKLLMGSALRARRYHSHQMSPSIRPLPPWFPAPGMKEGKPEMNGGPMDLGMTLFLCVLLIPFVAVGTGMAAAAIINLVGKVEVVIDDADPYVGIGVGFVRWKRRFHARDIRAVNFGNTSWQSDGESK